MELHFADRATNDPPRFVDEQLAKITGISRRTWQRHRLYSQGPRFYKMYGLVRYGLNEVLAWIRSPAGGKGSNGSGDPRVLLSGVQPVTNPCLK